MIITIQRFYFTRDICQGVMTVEGKPDFKLLTLESALPRDLQSYVGHCLPHGEYACTASVLPVSYKGVSIRVPWLLLNNVKWFPHGKIVCANIEGTPQHGEIFLGAERIDNGFAVNNPDDEAMKMWVRLSDEVLQSGEKVTLRIINSPDIIFEDTYRDKAQRMALEEEERRRRDDLMKELLGHDYTQTDCAPCAPVGNSD